jgi:hypothetical protein
MYQYRLSYRFLQVINNVWNLIIEYILSIFKLIKTNKN